MNYLLIISLVPLFVTFPRVDLLIPPLRLCLFLPVQEGLRYGVRVRIVVGALHLLYKRRQVADGDGHAVC